MRRLRFHINLRSRIWISRADHQGVSPKWKTLYFLVALLCLASACYAQDGLVGKWRPLDDTNIIHGFSYIPELKFAADGTLYAGIEYGYRIIDDGKFEWQLGNGIKWVYKYEITGDLLMLYAISAPDDRARFRRMR